MVFIGLGNPGLRYKSTRHNLGFMVLDSMAAKYGLVWSRGSRTYKVTEFELESTRVILVKPQTYMNLSGRAAVAVHARFENTSDELLAVVDDIALSLGHLRLRRRGSDGGHNGLRSIASELGTNDFSRLRLGVGSVPAGVDPADYVLDPFDDDETETANEMISWAGECLEAVIRQGFDRTMGEFNVPPPEGETG